MPVFVIAACDQLVLSEAVNKHIPKGVPCQTHYGWDLECDTIFEQLGSPGLFAEQQAYHYAEFTKISLRKKEADRFCTLLEKLSPQTTLVCSLLIDEEDDYKEKQKKGTADFKRVSSRGKFEDLCSLSDPREAVPWLQARALDKYGVVLEAKQVERMYGSCGNSISGVDSVLTKLWMFKPDDRKLPIPDSMLDKVLSDNPESKYNDLVNLVMAGDGNALTRLHDWFPTARENFRLVSELSRKLLQLKALAQGEKLPFWAEKQVRPFVRYYRGQKLKQAILLAAEMEQAMKTGAIPGENTEAAKLVLLELYVKRLGLVVTG